MPNRDWDKELADIDRRLAAVPDAPAATPVAGTPAAPPTVVRKPNVADRAPVGGMPPVVTTTPRRTWKTNAALAFRLLLAVVLLACVVVWPYETRCGLGLGAYLGTIGVTVLAALWTSIAAWRHRTAALHVLGLAMLLAAGVYAGREVLPRVGYALPDADHPTVWACR